MAGPLQGMAETAPDRRLAKRTNTSHTCGGDGTNGASVDRIEYRDADDEHEPAAEKLINHAMNRSRNDGFLTYAGQHTRGYT